LGFYFSVFLFHSWSTRITLDVMYVQDGKMLDKLEGADVPLLTQKATAFASSADTSSSVHGDGGQASSTPTGSLPDVSGRIKFILTHNPLVLFMKVRRLHRQLLQAGDDNHLLPHQACLHTVDP
jgi:hypothetical protein